MAVRPYGDLILVRRIDPETTTSGGIIIPEEAQKRPSQGVVVSLGPGCVDSALEAGDVVLHGNYTGQEIEVGGETLLFLKEDDVLGVVEPGE